ncbi:MAG TPA: lytic transglycosylase domain-containing protein [Fervidobacterium sp.]|nr:lytic transglycosylase [Fervidobacterium sp.]HOK88206.1 lytic transglycosylase domain-containing protein [Fervidobacterium sp.]HOM74299.1 lytic transglycosylase domain-containing protein [Fervidobacterium sp.]HOQ39832.1 lytic transglycosylase domain-containing protein [Fervidobacterium sp.]HPP17985.1 lytic transglycosylase domain-containing protein [Fervidobacterium sp.]
MRLIISCILTLLVVTIFLFFQFFPLKYYNTVLNYSGNIDPLLVLSVIKVESSFREGVTSVAGAYGLMQLMPETAEWVNKKFKTNYDYTNPQDNIALGCMYLNYLLERDGDIKTALVHYNTGPYAPDNVKLDAGERYVKKIMRYYKVYKMLYGRGGQLPTTNKGGGL